MGIASKIKKIKAEDFDSQFDDAFNETEIKKHGTTEAKIKVKARNERYNAEGARMRAERIKAGKAAGNTRRYN